MDYRTVADLAACIRTRLAERIPQDIDLVVGIAPSGMIAANLIALRLNLQVTDVQGYTANRGRKSSASGARQILLVDDSVTTGLRCEGARNSLKSTAERHGDPITTLAVYGVPGATGGCDITLEEVPLPRLFEWSYMHHAILSDACLCLDGVLCIEPPAAEKNSDTKYRHFFKTTPPLILPSIEIGTILTCRLEKYRVLTENWLQRNGVRYRNLIMMEAPTKSSQMASSDLWQFKTEAFKRTAGRLFIESDPVQAKAVARQTGLPVLCIGSNEMLR